MIYFAQHPPTTLVKIGYSNNYKRRMVQLKRYYGKLEIVGLLSGYLDTEYAIQKRFSHMRVDFADIDTRAKRWIGRTEWFKYTPELRGFIKAHTKRTIPLDLFGSNSVYGNSRFYPDGRQPMTIRESRKDFGFLFEQALSNAA